LAAPPSGRSFFSHLHALLGPEGRATLWLRDAAEMPEALAALLARQGFGYRLTRVTAIPDKRCAYSQSNEFYLPVFSRTKVSGVS
jgi:hypothetical protein